MSPELASFAHHVATALVVGGAVGFLVMHFWPRGSAAATSRGCAHCPANVTVTGPTYRAPPSSSRDDGSTAGRAIRTPRLHVLD